MIRKEQVPAIVVVLPFAYQDGIDKYNGIMRYLRETGTEWELCIVGIYLTYHFGMRSSPSSMPTWR